MEPICVPPGEKQIGIETFFTTTPGIGGKIKTTPQDFIVHEDSIPPLERDGPFTIATVTACNWETTHLLLTLAKKMGIHPHKIGISGTKDKRAVTTQMMSFKKPVDAVETIKLKDVELSNIYTSNRPIMWGNHHGNYFTIIIRDIHKEASTRIETIAQTLLDIKGFPNFFGVQRFGITRPITHLVGQLITQKKYEDAVMTYIANPLPGETQASYDARAEVMNTRNFSTAAHQFPQHLIFEKLMLQHLAKYPTDWTGALATLPLNLLQMFIHSYQSFLFNKILSQRLHKKHSLTEAIVGDVILPVRKNQVIATRHGIPITEHNIQKVNTQLSQGRGYISSILPGYETTYGEGTMGKLEKHIIQQHTPLTNFIIPDLPRISSRGSRRTLIAPLTNLDYIINPDHIILKFRLLKGCYATSLLREFMKTDTTHYR